jgi:2-succinyl-6-hydroxy-2,4-cyclohexadiene-1-carboxylate synthase
VSEPLVLLHGFTGSPASWDDVLAALPDRDIVRPTLLGHEGRPDAPRSFDAELERLSQSLPKGPLHLAGYSLGARLALGLALHRPESVTRLTLIGVHPGLASEAGRAERRRADQALAELLETRGIGPFVDFWERQPLFATQARLDPARRDRKRAERLRHDPHGLAASLRSTGLGEMPDYGERLGSLAAPVTLLCGELDTKFVALAAEVKQRLPRAEVVIAPHSGHDLLLERPELVARLLAAG